MGGRLAEPGGAWFKSELQYSFAKETGKGLLAEGSFLERAAYICTSSPSL